MIKIEAFFHEGCIIQEKNSMKKSFKQKSFQAKFIIKVH
jgi:hypothetical protein